MSVVTFWNDDREQTGKTLTAVAVATKMAIERNLKILLISTSYNDKTMQNCFVEEKTNINSIKMLTGKINNIAVENGISGISKLVSSNKIEPSVITDYTRVILKNRLEVITGYMPAELQTYEENHEAHQKIAECYSSLIELANQYYDIVIVDLDKQLNKVFKDEIFAISNLNVYVISQRLESLNTYINRIEKQPELKKLNHMMVIGKFYDKTKYNKKNVMRYLRTKELNIIPFNMLFFESAEEHSVTELFLKMRNIKDKQDENYIFTDEIQKIVDKVIARLKELQKKMR